MNNEDFVIRPTEAGSGSRNDVGGRQSSGLMNSPSSISSPQQQQHQVRI